MSEGQRSDLKNTILEMKNSTGYSDGLNWLRHRRGSQSALIDEILTKGMTESEMVREIDRKGLNTKNKTFDSMLGRIRQHFKHLTLPLKEDNPNAKSKYQYDIWGHGLHLLQDTQSGWKFDLNKMEQIANIPSNQSTASVIFYLPTMADIDLALSLLRKSPVDEIGIEAVLDQVEVNYKNAGKMLKPNWREIIRRNIDIWYGKNR